MKRFVPMVAIDVATKQEAIALFDKLMVDPQPIVKIGMELYYGLGQVIVCEAKKRGFKVFLDLKLYDIPNTVHRAMAAIGRLGIDFTTIHAAGGSEMMIAGLAGLEEGAKEVGVAPAKLLAITQLTSIDEQILHEQQHVDLSLIESVQNYAQLAERVGLAGVVCSAHEIKAIRKVTGDDFLCVTPGIRPVHALKDDQKRVVTPVQARIDGSNAIVVGRPITQSVDPVAAYQKIQKAFLNEEEEK
ncbi:orotidine-5'-phosphate decarboxylase [Limosilactobacillus sp. STM2_1]|uniref:Orotidine 5'-phosphate decarboxylase n=1 Tax=Limosilactobacillus rudii TaxID=2759755 RepID=A0A7W3UN15_9LACO|nr:orotidine-5'-phosphate decarboxylase [Limosilactobacillus rudii]MBB1078830.1 orotidine-5'-phosphate decarboxylase [Limosilactobacillus rudii]MBB1098095.1 orotidine-5'-phosphate decarboxylase [Limosilactobacillus rudii]MCD7135165.1 orotidine-5'-phosphate decarboxylase [Limosilactobacillus rudii]